MNRKLALLILFTSMVGLGLSVTNPSRPTEMSSVSPVAVFDYNSLKQMIDSQNLKSIDEVIPLLPLSLRDNVTLMYQSKSIQKASLQRPRAILFGDDAKTIITFGGDPKLAGFNSLEIMQFVESRSRYEMHEIDFVSGRAQYATNGETQAKCTTCHGVDPHPIWTAYNTWSGAYGEADDDIGKRPLSEGAFFDPSVALRELKEDPELPPRYKAVFAKHDSTWPYYDTSNPKNSQRSLTHMPNVRFSFLASLTRARQLARVISENSLYKKMGYSFLFVDLCDSPDLAPTGRADKESIALIRDEIAQKCEIPLEENWHGTRDQWLAMRGSYPKDLINFFGVPNGDASIELKSYQNGATANGIPQGLGSSNETARGLLINYLFEQMMRRDLSLYKIGNQYRASFPKPKDYKGKDAILMQAPYGFSREVDRQPYFKSAKLPKAACAYLKQRSKLEISALQREAKFSNLAVSINSVDQLRQGVSTDETIDDVERGRKLLSSSGCISCHDRNGDLQLGPEIDFSDPQKFSELNEASILKTGRSLIDNIRFRISNAAGYERRMPLSSRDLGVDEQSALLHYLESITVKDR